MKAPPMKQLFSADEPPSHCFIIWGRSTGGLAGGPGETQWTPHAEAVISKTYSYYKKKN